MVTSKLDAARRLICEFIDHDASGIITTQEVNLFLQRKPEQCSMEAWFALCALSVRCEKDVPDQVFPTVGPWGGSASTSSEGSVGYLETNR